MSKEDIDYMEFVTPYTKKDKLLRLLWTIVWNLLARPFPRSSCMPWKRMLLRLFGAKMSSTSKVYASAKIYKPWHLTMKDHATIGDDVDCYNAAPVTIGINATISQGTFLCTASHDIESQHHEQTEKPIVIGDRAWVAAHAYIGPGVTVGEGAVVGATASVYKDVEPWTVVGGNPSKVLKRRVINK